jgi:hypothetical protein
MVPCRRDLVEVFYLVAGGPSPNRRRAR